jgi:hypothetical protein
MKNLKFSADDYCEGRCTRQQFIEQYDPIKLELGKVYIQDKGSWSEKHYKIIFMEDEIALGVSVYNAIGDRFIGDYVLFYLENGFKYKDVVRPSYRLSEEVLLTTLA